MLPSRGSGSHPEGFALRSPRPTDAFAYHALAQDPDVRLWSRPAEMSVEDAQAELAAAAAARHGTSDIVVIADSRDALVGTLSVTWHGAQRASIGYDLLATARGRGIATAALRQLSERLFDEHPELARIELWSIVGNDASDRVAERAGFRREGVLRARLSFRGTLRDVTVFSFLRTDVP